jgi:acyl-CoA synthetase (NDP forming)
VPSAVEEAGAAGASFAVVFSGGFSETGPPGAELEERLRAAAASTGIRVVGPNSGGVIAPADGVAMSFLTCLDRPADQIRPGPVGLVTQSGGTGSYVHNLAAERGGGLAISISTGNETDLDVADGIAALVARPDVGAVAVVLETVRRGEPFLDAVRAAVAAGKPVVVNRIGTTARGRAMMRTHTGAMATKERVIEEVCISVGATLVETPAEMLDVAEIMARTPQPAGDRTAVVSHSGGIAILLGDLAERHGLRLDPPSASLAARLEPLLEQARPSNPLDMGGIIGGPGRFAETVGAFGASGEYDLTLAVTSAHPPSHTRLRVSGLLGLPDHPPIVHLWMAGDLGAEGLADLRYADVPVTEEPRAAIIALAGMMSRRAATEEDHVLVEVSPSSPPGQMTERQAKDLVAAWGIPVVEGRLASSEEETVSAAAAIGYPVVVKLSSPDVTHKEAIGGVRTAVGDEHAVRLAHRAILVSAASRAPDAVVDGVLVEREVRGLELIVGALRDETFGPVVLVGFGGTLAEAVSTVAMAPAPLGFGRAGSLVTRSPVAAAVARLGTEGAAESLATVVARLGAGLVATPVIDEVELNPLVWDGRGWLALDAAAIPGSG